MKFKELTQQWGQDIEVNGKTIEVRVTVEVSYDELFDLIDFEPEDRVALGEKIDKGQLAPVTVQILGHIDGHMFGIDSLSGVLMESKQDIDDTIKAYSMIDNCLEETKKELINFLKKVS